MEQLKVIMGGGGGVCVFWGLGGEAVEKADRDCAWVQRAKKR